MHSVYVSDIICDPPLHTSLPAQDAEKRQCSMEVPFPLPGPVSPYLVNR